MLEPDGSLTGDIKALFSFFFFFSLLDFVFDERKKWTNVKVQRGWGVEIGSKSQLPTPTTWSFALHTLEHSNGLSVLVTRGLSVNAFRSLFALLLNWPV